MTFYGASVIHPKTIKPLANSGIPLFVKSFLKPEAAGTKIFQLGKQNPIPTIVLKQNQILVTFRVTDFTFIEEEQIHTIYEQLNVLKLRVNFLQTSAISVSIIIDQQLFKLEQLVNSLKNKFIIRYNEGLELLTVLHPDRKDFSDLNPGYEILLEQSTRNTVQFVRRKE
jgi:aspartate kinase